MTIQAMRERRNGLAIEARKLLDETKDKPWTPEHQTKYDTLTGDISDLDGRIEREPKVLDLAAEQHLASATPKTCSRISASSTPGPVAVSAVSPTSRPPSSSIR